MSAFAGAAARAGRAGRGLVPSGQLLTPEVWARRHRGIVWLLWLHVAGVAVFALTRGKSLAHTVAEVSPMVCSPCPRTGCRSGWPSAIWVVHHSVLGVLAPTSVFNHAYEDSSELLERADQVLYAAKAEGRDRYVLAS